MRDFENMDYSWSGDICKIAEMHTDLTRQKAAFENKNTIIKSLMRLREVATNPNDRPPFFRSLPDISDDPKEAFVQGINEAINEIL